MLNRGMYMKKFFLVLLSLSFFSCYSTHKFLNTDINPGGRIAVVIAETKYDDVNTIIANSMSELLEAKSKLTVVHQHKVKSIIGTYPERIRGPYKHLGDEIEPDNKRRDMDTLAVYAKKLNVNYLYVFWIPICVESKIITTDPYGNTRESAGFTGYYYIGELIEFPSRRIIAQGEAELSYIPNATVIGSRKPAASSREMAINFSELAVDEIIKNTGIGK